MSRPRAEDIVVGVLGQWASGKTTAAKTLVRHLGGEQSVEFITDAVLVASQVANHILELDESQLKRSLQEDGTLRLEGEHAVIRLRPGEDLRTVDLETLLFDVDDDFLPAWLHRARVDMGHRICDTATGEKPIVVEAGFGRNPPGHTIRHLFADLQEAGAEPNRIRWIIVEAGFDKRWERNVGRGFGPPVEAFSRYAADGGDLDPTLQAELEAQGLRIRRILNDHDDVKRFKMDVIVAFEELFSRPVDPAQAP